MQLNSEFFQTVANLLRHIESLGVAPSEYGILDSGQTLELSTALHEQIKETLEFKAFENVGGNHYCFDDDSWTVESGIQLSHLNAIFEV
jgi:hypothetical protein